MTTETADPLHWPLVTEYLDYAADGRLMVPECRDCEEAHFPPRVVCPYCLSSSVELRESDGHGTLYSFSVVHLEYHPTWGNETPYVNALVSLDDGPTVFANVVDCDPASLSVGDSLTVTFEAIEEQLLPMFRPD
ncbi:Zn-ribbon domain-containing OB-fold protein [Haloferax sp. YSMS24]|uniref:Zn-ribbon domain-containing OB-fold protein n=1 Tax=Haloferax sp. YSMS24 TaxID=3388425 RepID=UPI00398CBD9E